MSRRARPPPRVLMLGWEFPPHISGGLGTACHGLTRGLAANGVEVVFVVPRVHDEEEASHVRLLACDGTPVARSTLSRPASGRPSETSGPFSPAHLAAIALGAELHPYASAASNTRSR